jgi:hypothetical protein
VWAVVWRTPPLLFSVPLVALCPVSALAPANTSSIRQGRAPDKAWTTLSAASSDAVLAASICRSDQPRIDCSPSYGCTTI